MTYYKLLWRPTIAALSEGSVRAEHGEGDSRQFQQRVRFVVLLFRFHCCTELKFSCLFTRSWHANCAISDDATALRAEPELVLIDTLLLQVRLSETLLPTGTL